MQTKSEKVLPKTTREIANGGVYAQAVRCGKSNCKCSSGNAHTAFYFFTRHNGKLVKFYVRKADVENFSRLVELANAERKARRRTSKDSTELLKKLRVSLGNNDGLIKSIKGSENYAENRI